MKYMIYLKKHQKGEINYEYRNRSYSKHTGQKRIAIMVGAGYIPGINAVVAGASLAAGKLGWELVGIRDGFEGIASSRKISRWRINCNQSPDN